MIVFLKQTKKTCTTVVAFRNIYFQKEKNVFTFFSKPTEKIHPKPARKKITTVPLGPLATIPSNWAGPVVSLLCAQVTTSCN